MDNIEKTSAVVFVAIFILLMAWIGVGISGQIRYGYTAAQCRSLGFDGVDEVPWVWRSEGDAVCYRRVYESLAKLKEIE